jgi:hypothetical protein
MDAKGKVIFDDPLVQRGWAGAVVSNLQAVYLIKENPFFNMHIEKAAQHARAAEIAGNQGQAIDLLEHARCRCCKPRKRSVLAMWRDRTKVSCP